MNFIKFLILGIQFIFTILIKFIKYFLIGLLNIIIFIPKYFVIGTIFIFNKKKRKKIKQSDNKKLSWIIISISLTIYLICIFLFSRWYVQGLKIKYLSNDIINTTEIIEKEEQKEEPIQVPSESTTTSNEETNNNVVYYPNDYWDYLNIPFIDVNFNELIEKNPDTVGWIKVEGTKVNYPIVQATDNDYYLSHAFNKSANQGGWIFADYRVNFKDFGKNTIIYGHNMNNKTMFGSIPNMLYTGYLNNSSNYYIKVSTPYSNSIWKVFSIYTIEPEVYYLKTNFKSESYSNFLSTIKNRSIYNFGIDVNENDKILTLSTCDNTGTKRVAVHAKMINIEYK